MNVEIVRQEKDELEIKIDNQTIAEVLRFYLNERVSGVKFAAWRKEHPSKPIIMKIQASGVKKAISDAIAAIDEDCNAILAGLKK